MSEPIVLIVDDEPNVVLLCQRLLERTHYHVLTVSSSGQALEILDKQRVDLLIADIRMPGLDGIQLISQARKVLPDLAAILMTGYGTLETALTALQKGVDGLILKPFSGLDFVQNVERALAERQRRKELHRLQALKPLLEVSETLFALTDQDLLASTLVEVVHKTFANGFTGLFSYRQLDSSENEVAQTGLSWEIVASLSEPRWSDDQAVQLLQDNLPFHASLRPILLPSREESDPGWEQVLARSDQGSLIFVPIPAKKTQLAVLALRPVQMEVYTRADLEILIILARHSAVAFENTRLYSDLTDSLNQIERSQNALLQAERLAAAGRLTASIAHEINNPLQSLQNCLDLVARTGLETEQRQKYLDMAISELNRLMNTVQRMLAFYRPIVRDRKLVNLNEIIRRTIDLLKPQFEAANIRVRDQMDPEHLPIIAVDSQIQQVIFNLLINSMEAMPDGGEILISSKKIPDIERKSVEVVIADNGPGIPGEQLARLFEPMMSSKPNGTGLGLAVSYGIVEAHGGSLKLVPGVRQGASFQIILPEN